MLTKEQYNTAVKQLNTLVGNDDPGEIWWALCFGFEEVNMGLTQAWFEPRDPYSGDVLESVNKADALYLLANEFGDHSVESVNSIIGEYFNSNEDVSLERVMKNAVVNLLEMLNKRYTVFCTSKKNNTTVDNVDNVENVAIINGKKYKLVEVAE